MKELHRHLKAEKKAKINDHSKVMNDHSDWEPKKSLSYLVHPRGSEEDPHFFGVFLQFPVLIVVEL